MNTLLSSFCLFETIESFCDGVLLETDGMVSFGKITSYLGCALARKRVLLNYEGIAASVPYQAVCELTRNDRFKAVATFQLKDKKTQSATIIAKRPIEDPLGIKVLTTRQSRDLIPDLEADVVPLVHTLYQLRAVEKLSQGMKKQDRLAVRVQRRERIRELLRLDLKA